MVFLADRGGPFNVWLSQIGTSEPVNVTQGKVPAQNPGAIRRVGFFGDGHIWISKVRIRSLYTLDGAGAGRRTSSFFADAMEPAWSPDGKAMAYHTVEPGDPIFVADRSGRSPKKSSPQSLEIIVTI